MFSIFSFVINKLSIFSKRFIISFANNFLITIHVLQNISKLKEKLDLEVCTSFVSFILHILHGHKWQSTVVFKFFKWTMWWWVLLTSSVSTSRFRSVCATTTSSYWLLYSTMCIFWCRWFVLSNVDCFYYNFFRCKLIIFTNFPFTWSIIAAWVMCVVAVLGLTAIGCVCDATMLLVS